MTRRQADVLSVDSLQPGVVLSTGKTDTRPTISETTRLGTVP